MDRRLYLINLSKTFPSDRNFPENSLQQFRPEFVKSYKKPLSSDSFYNVTEGAPDAETNNTEVKEAGQYLLNHIIPAFVKELDILDVLPYDSTTLTQEMHSRGINMRYLGKVAELTK